MTTVFSENLKKFRQKKKLTQEQAAQALGVSTQSISRWECNVALPDVLRLPEIARLYGVTVDDLYKNTTASYENYAQRLAALYSQSRKPSDFICADEEFEKRRKNGEYSFSDMLFHAHIHQSMMLYCNEKALTLFDAILENCDEDEIYWKARLHKNNHLMFIGETEECIKAQEEAFKKSPHSRNEFEALIITYYLAGRYGEGYECYLASKDRFEPTKKLLTFAGNLCSELSKFDEATFYYEKAKELDKNDPKLYYNWARTYEKMGDYEKAAETWAIAASLFEKDGFDIEAQSAMIRSKNIYSI